ncbi:MAG: carbohydrate ABC transporter permease [Planctomycetes bacterium]|nr:carbohydrate ABC transporter permease [Planctomycetota bacterium]
MRHSVLATRLMIYSALVLGAVVFAMPFVWMGATSVKVDRELFTRELTIFPMAPRPRPVSPYIDEDYYPSAQGPHRDAVLAHLIHRVRRMGFAFPPDVDRADAETQLARGLFDRLRRILPDAQWQGPVSALLAAADKAVDRKMVAETFTRIDRRLILGPLRARTLDLVEYVLDDSETTIAYDFRTTDRRTWTRTVPLEFDPATLQRLQLNLHPDDTWHRLYLTVETAGRRYVAERPVVLVNFDWIVLTWRPPNPDDRSLTRAKTWITLVPAGTSTVTVPRQMRLTFELRRSSLLRAWGEKIALNYRRVLDYIPFWRYVKVSLVLVLLNVVLTLLSCSLVAYAFARLRWPGRDFCFALMLATLMIPAQVTMIPHFLIWRYLGLYNTLVPLWLPSAFGVPFYIFLLRQFMKGIPTDLEDAARIDGAGFLRIYAYVILPLVRPSLTAIAIFTFLASWNDFLGPLIYLSDQRLYPLAFGLFAFSLEAGNNPTLTMAASLLMTLPVIVIFFFTQRYFIQGITMTGLKA